MEENLYYLTNQSPLFATPCYGGVVHEPYLRGMTSIASYAATIGMSINMATVVNESLITRARNELLSHFLRTDASHIFFIDADIEFTPQQVLKVLSHDKDVVVGAYPLKKISWESIKHLEKLDIDEIKSAVTEYVINVKFKNDEDKKLGKLDVVDGLIEVYDAGTGFMCIKRNVIEKMIEHHPETRYKKEKDFVNELGDDGTRYALFDTMIDKDTQRYLSEDYTFCRRWQQMGGQVWLDPKVTLSHVGAHRFEGRQFFDIREV